jgi:hypothetical protein
MFQAGDSVPRINNPILIKCRFEEINAIKHDRTSHQHTHLPEILIPVGTKKRIAQFVYCVVIIWRSVFTVLLCGEIIA